MNQRKHAEHGLEHLPHDGIDELTDLLDDAKSDGGGDVEVHLGDDDGDGEPGLELDMEDLVGLSDGQDGDFEGGNADGSLDLEIVLEPDGGDGGEPGLDVSVNGHEVPLDGLTDLDGEDTGLHELAEGDDGEHAGHFEGGVAGDFGDARGLSLDGDLDGHLDAGATGQGNHPDAGEGEADAGGCSECCPTGTLVETEDDAANGVSGGGDDFEHLLLVTDRNAV